MSGVRKVGALADRVAVDGGVAFVMKGADRACAKRKDLESGVSHAQDVDCLVKLRLCFSQYKIKTSFAQYWLFSRQVIEVPVNRTSYRNKNGRCSVSLVTQPTLPEGKPGYGLLYECLINRLRW